MKQAQKDLKTEAKQKTVPLAETVTTDLLPETTALPETTDPVLDIPAQPDAAVETAKKAPKHSRKKAATAITDTQETPLDPDLETEPEETPQGLDPESLQLLSFLLSTDQELSDKFADLLLNHYNRRDTTMTGFEQGSAEQAMADAGAGDFFAPDIPAEGLSAAPATPGELPQVMSRLERLEQGYVQQALDRELAEVAANFNTMREQFPILPELDQQRIMQISLERGAIPLNDALAIWAMEQMRAGEGSPADRLVAAAMAKGKGRNVPTPEGKGGVPPVTEERPPETLREARGMARDRLRALFAGPAGQ